MDWRDKSSDCSALLGSIVNASGFCIPGTELESFRQWNDHSENQWNDHSGNEWRESHKASRDSCCLVRCPHSCTQILGIVL
jgi:hypothetical protein